jgi:superfamily II DNA or RNA helicase
MCSNLKGITRDKHIDNQAVSINGVFGGEFESLNEHEFDNIRRVIDNQIPVYKKVQLKPHQLNAISLIKEHFVDEKKSRGQIIHACGTGKTITSYYAYKELKPKIAIYLVPSLQLVTQTLNEWSNESLANNKPISPFIVCSDKTNEKIEETDPKLWLQELGIKVSNKQNEINRFISSSQPRKVIFSTYQSGKILASNLKAINIVPDLCFFDEAHNTASSKLKLFGHLLSDDNLKIKHRLFLTATPRVIRGINHKYFSMNDEKFYGKVIDEITFKDAIEDLEMLNDYRIITQLVSDEDARKLLINNPFVFDKAQLSEEIELKLIAAALTIKKIVKSKNIKNIVSFHHRRNRAMAFSKGINNIDKETHLNHFYVDGKQSGTMRQRTLAEFARTQPSIVANAKCLSEGVDVPAIDSIVFVDPRQSVTSITQAIGRALRKPKGQKKGMSYIIVPTIINANNSDNIEESYQEILMVLRSMSEHDGRIVEYFRLVKEGKTPPKKFLEINSEHPIISFDLEQFSKSLHIKAWDRVSRLGRRPFEHVKEFAQQSSIKSQTEWFAFVKTDDFPPDIPSNVSTVYKKEWVDWYDFLGKTRPQDIVTLNELKKFISKTDIDTAKKYRAFAKSSNFPSNFPRVPNEHYKDEWIDWYDLFGKKRPPEYVTLNELKEYISKTDIDSINKWLAFGKLKDFPDNFPKNPDVYYKDEWIDWYDLFGKKRPPEYVTLNELKEQISKTNIDSSTKYFKFAKSEGFPSNFPRNPHIHYKDEWVDWYDFLGVFNPKNYRTFEETRAFAQGSEINTMKEWERAYLQKKIPRDLPKNPNTFYKDEYIDAWDFFGKANPVNYVSLNELKEYISKTDIDSSSKYMEFAKSKDFPSRFPKKPHIYFKDEWVDWYDFLNKDPSIKTWGGRRKGGGRKK